MSHKDWFLEFSRKAIEDNDPERKRLLRFYHEGFALREKDPEQAFQLFNQGRHLAQQLNEPWMVMFFDEWRGTALLHFKRDFRNVLELAVQAALDVRKPQYAGFPEKFGIYDNLIAAYIGIDPLGYEPAILQALDYLETEVPDEPDSQRYLLIARRRILNLELDRVDVAYDFCLREQVLADRDRERSRADHFSVFLYCALCQIAHQKGRWDDLEGWSETGDDITRRVGHQVELSELLAWRAVSALRRGETDRALRLSRSATSRQKAQKMPPTRGFYDALCTYHEILGEVPKMLDIRERELNDVSGWGRFHCETRCRTHRLELLKRLGKPMDDELSAARDSARRLRIPEPYLKRIEAIVSAEEKP
jgi:hypothetical protein